MLRVQWYSFAPPRWYTFPPPLTNHYTNTDADTDCPSGAAHGYGHSYANQHPNPDSFAHTHACAVYPSPNSHSQHMGRS